MENTEAPAPTNDRYFTRALWNIRQIILEGEVEAAEKDWVRQEQEERRDKERVVPEKVIRTELVAKEKAAQAARDQYDKVFGSRLFAGRGCYSRAHDCSSFLITRAGSSISGCCTTARYSGLAW